MMIFLHCFWPCRKLHLVSSTSFCCSSNRTWIPESKIGNEMRVKCLWEPVSTQQPWNAWSCSWSTWMHCFSLQCSFVHMFFLGNWCGNAQKPKCFQKGKICNKLGKCRGKWEGTGRLIKPFAACSLPAVRPRDQIGSASTSKLPWWQ